MRPRDLTRHVVGGLDLDVIRIEGKDAVGLAWRRPAQLRDGHLRREASTRFQVRGCVGEDRQLVVQVVRFTAVSATWTRPSAITVFDILLLELSGGGA